MPTLCPAWKRGHCTGEGWCPKRHAQPGPDDGALPEVGRAAACAALRYGVAQGLILDEIARGSVNIQEAVDRVTHAGQAAVALHTRGRHGGPAEKIIVEPSGMVLVLAADMVRGVLHASRVRRARQRGSASRQPSNGTPTRGHATSCRRARSRPPRQTTSGDGAQGRRNRCRAPGSSRCGICPSAPSTRRVFPCEK